MDVPSIFDPRLRVRRRERALANFAAHDFLYAAMANDLIDRIDDVKRRFTQALVIGCPDGRLVDALRERGATVTPADPAPALAEAVGGEGLSEDALPYAPESFDLIVSCGTLDAVNDLPGAFIAMNRALRPDGLLLVSFVGAGSLPQLRAALFAGDGERIAQRLHPQVEVRALGDLLYRAGFAMPVADHERLTVRYGSIFPLMADLRGMGSAQCLASQPPPLSRAGLARAAAAFADAADPDGRTSETFMLLHGSGWRPAPDQPRPARRGSGKMSLAKALKSRIEPERKN